MKISHSILIDSKPETVFAWISDPEKAKVWMTSVSKTEYINRTPDLVGTTFREILEENGQGTELSGIVTGYAPNESISFHLDGQYNVVDVAYILLEIEHSTCLTVDAIIHFKSLLKIMSIFLGPAFKKKTLEQIKLEFEKLKALCERNNIEA